jgi:hypothetical protein
MALRFNKHLPAMLALLAIIVQFAPELSETQRSLGSSGLWLAAIILNFIVAPPDLGEKPPRIIWDERDSGEQFSIAMFHILLLCISFFIAYRIALDANAPDGVKWMNILAVLVAASGIWLVVANWKKRNDR